VKTCGQLLCELEQLYYLIFMPTAVLLYGVMHLAFKKWGNSGEYVEIGPTIQAMRDKGIPLPSERRNNDSGIFWLSGSSCDSGDGDGGGGGD
jgi:hypothetical protein